MVLSSPLLDGREILRFFREDVMNVSCPGSSRQTVWNGQVGRVEKKEEAGAEGANEETGEGGGDKEQEEISRWSWR